MIDTHHIAPCYAYREKYDYETEFEFGQRVANELERKIEELGSQNVMAFVAEPVVGATLGAVPAVDGYFKTIREICNHNGVLLILDEVMCGMGRTGTLFAYEQESIAPDIVCVAKGLGAGYQPIGATICTDVESFRIGCIGQMDDQTMLKVVDAAHESLKKMGVTDASPPTKALEERKLLQS